MITFRIVKISPFLIIALLTFLEGLWIKHKINIETNPDAKTDEIKKKLLSPVYRYVRWIVVITLASTLINTFTEGKLNDGVAVAVFGLIPSLVITAILTLIHCKHMENVFKVPDSTTTHVLEATVAGGMAAMALSCYGRNKKKSKPDNSDC